jgi:hypothetical protein
MAADSEYPMFPAADVLKKYFPEPAETPADPDLEDEGEDDDE